jgi:hypothetical protein
MIKKIYHFGILNVLITMIQSVMIFSTVNQRIFYYN